MNDLSHKVAEYRKRQEAEMLKERAERKKRKRAEWENYNMSVNVKTSSEKGVIELRTYLDKLSEAHTKVIVDTQERHIREALIEMGWTPPEEKTNGLNERL